MSAGLGTVLVTGATGFIGAALAARLTTRLTITGARTACLVRADSPRRGRLEGVAGVEITPVASFSTPELARAVGAIQPEVVFHLAASGVNPSERDPELVVDGNVGLTTRLLAALAATEAHRPARFVHAGSCSEYAPAPEPTRLREDHPLEPTCVYGAAKAAAYLCGRAAAARLGIPFVALRIFGVYGPGEGPARLIPHLLARFRAGEAPALTPGAQARDLTYVDDVVEALLAAATSRGLESGRAYNVCSGAPVRVREVAALVARAAGWPGDDLGLGRRPYRDDEPMWIVGDPSRFAEATGWRPRVPLDEGVRRMIEAADAEGAP
ncbi:NAD-dependent epimerase/dehydratase family protein [Sorangium sp. So ce1000]|uniref:NAD-dependent epimerase/dehydratase family protein n=1 Tax=Sorangium sp. So ce1000 TaxID=3133325 RepID=UPI003F639005